MSQLKITNLTQAQSFFLGKLKEKFNVYTSEEKEELQNNIDELTKSIELQHKDIEELDIDAIICILDYLMIEILEKENIRLEGYEKYQPSFDFKKKAIVLKEDKKIIKNIGSSSNHLFLHLVFFNAIHRFFIQKNIPYIPPFVIIDQIDSPYYSSKDNNEKVVFLNALKILDNQITYCNNELNEDFQIILLEHIEWEELEKSGFKNYHLVEEWREDGEGLIPKSFLKPRQLSLFDFK